jgi:hypothetical protein
MPEKATLARRHSYILISILLLSCFCVHLSFAQTGHKKLKKAIKKIEKGKEKKADAILSAGSIAIHKPVDTVIIIDPKTGKPIDPRKNLSLKPFRKPDTIIYIDNGKPRQANPPPGILHKFDTVIVIKNGKHKKEQQAILKDTVKAKIVTVSPLCNCVTMKLKAPDTLGYNDYVNYSFIFKNNCKEVIWINSASFGFNVSQPDGGPVRILHKLQFTKQYRYPEFVPLSPGQEYSFDFGDDPFFQYELHRNWRYKFNFTYYNAAYKYKGASNKTYLCTELRDKTIVIVDEVKRKK